jgi:hypothetical protein
MTDTTPEEDPTDNPLAAFLASLMGKDIGELAKMLSEVQLPELEDINTQAEALLTEVPPITDKETVLNGARLRLASMIGGETVMVTQDLAHLAYHLKEELKDEEVYKLITALIVKMYSSLTSCRGPIVSEALKIASKEGLTAAEAAAILNSADDYHPNLTEAEVNIGVALCKHSVFTSVGNQNLRELFKLCWTDNPHVEGN